MGNEVSMSQSTALMAGKRGLVMGVANDRSLAWGITSALHEHGAELALTYQNETMEKRVRPLAERVDASLLLKCDVAEDGAIDAAFAELAGSWDRVDFAVHAVAFSDKNELTGRYVDTSAANFAQTMAVSCYSFTALCRAAAPMMTGGGSLVTLTYAGSERVVPHYNVMGVAKAALEASVRYLAVDLGGDNIRARSRPRASATSATS
jgi:enoyl-[acyl-carrier protein] reductase I